MEHRVIGSGPVGYTAAGLDRVGTEMLARLTLPHDAEVSVEVPAFSVIGADVFDSFMARNHLSWDGLAGLADRQIARRFVGAEMPNGLAEDVAAVVDELDGPIVVRPSSVLEETHDHSFGGAYVAKLLPNIGSDRAVRVQRLAEAVRLVWASTYFRDAVSWRRGAGVAAADEHMAVVIQRAVGCTHGQYFYPTLSVIARSYNHYPVPGNEPGDGVVTVALGFGKAIGEGHAWSYCPARPTAPPPFKSIGDMLKYTQTGFWALDLTEDLAPRPYREDEFLVRLGLAEAEADGVLDLLVSTYDAENDRLREGCDGAGARVLTFAPLLRSKAIPFTPIVREILDQTRAATGREVEVELAVTIDPVTGAPIRFGVVQLKTLGGGSAAESIDASELDAGGVVVASEDCLGAGSCVDVTDVVYLKPQSFDRSQTRSIASELDAINRGLLEEGRQAIFVGFGRWGTTDDRYGVPVRWGQISSARVIVEIAMPNAPLNLSQGTHFFHHLLKQKVLYLSVEHDARRPVDFQRLDAEQAIWEGRFVRHVCFDEPLEVRVDGGSRRGLIRTMVG